MCGIVGGFGTDVQVGITSLRHRGPDAEGVTEIGEIKLGHTRLAIIDLDTRSDQPFVYRNITMTFNGEIWNYKDIKANLEKKDYIFTTKGDTEILAAALSEWGVDAFQRIEGMFAVAWTNDGENLFLARDRFGEVPLHFTAQQPFMFASEIKALLVMGARPRSIRWVEPGTWIKTDGIEINAQRYHNVNLLASSVSFSKAAVRVHDLIEKGVDERTISDVPVCMLVSGGIDSSVIAFHLSKTFSNLTAYTAVYDDRSRDLRCAREIAAAFEIDLVEVRVPLPTADDLTRIINLIEMPHKVQVEIGWACLKLADAINSDGFKVTFSGEGSDELWGSYGFAYHALKKKNWHAYRKDLFIGQHRKNFARCNKIFMSRSIECRLPFLNTSLVEYAVSLPKHIVENGGSMKSVLREAYMHDLPSSVTSRPKVAFQDGMGLKKKIASIVAAPRSFYTAEFKSKFQGVIA